MANSYNVNALPDYVDQNRDELIAKAVLSDNVLSKLTLMTGVKGPTALNRIETDVVFGDGSTCGWNEAGATSLSQRTLIGQPIKINMAICDKVLLDKWAAYKVRVEAGKTDRDLPFERELVNGIIENVKSQLVQRMFSVFDPTQQTTGNWGAASEAIEKSYLYESGLWNYILDWNGTNNVGVGTYKLNVDLSDTTQETAYSYLKKVAAAFPAEILGKDDLVIFCSLPIFRMFIQDLVSANLYHYDPANGANEYKLPGTNITVIGVNVNTIEPLTSIAEQGYKMVLGGSLSNFFYGTNLEDGEEIFDVWYSKDNREFRVAIEFVAGSQVAYPAEAVIGAFKV